MLPAELFGPFALLAATLFVILAAVKDDPLWYSRAAYKAKAAEVVEIKATAERELERCRQESVTDVDRIRGEAKERDAEQRAAISKWERMALSNTNLLERVTGIEKPGAT